MIRKKHGKPQSEVISKRKVILHRQKQVLRRTNSFSHPKGRVSSGTERKPKVFIQAHTLWHMKARAGTRTQLNAACVEALIWVQKAVDTHKILKPAKQTPQLGHYFVPSHFWHFYVHTVKAKIQGTSPRHN